MHQYLVDNAQVRLERLLVHQEEIQNLGGTETLGFELSWKSNVDDAQPLDKNVRA